MGAVLSMELCGLNALLRSVIDPETVILEREDRTLLLMAPRGVLARANLRSDWSLEYFFLFLGRVVGDGGADLQSFHSVLVLNLSLAGVYLNDQSAVCSKNRIDTHFKLGLVSVLVFEFRCVILSPSAVSSILTLSLSQSDFGVCLLFTFFTVCRSKVE